MSVLRVSNLKKLYFSHEVLADVSFTLDRGDRLAIVGANGAGKTTLMRILTGKEKADGGFCAFANSIVYASLSQQMEELDDLSQNSLDDGQNEALNEAQHRSAALIAQLSAENLDDPLIQAAYRDALSEYDRVSARLHQHDGEQRKAEMASILAGLGLAGDILERPLATLSGGERMRVALARILQSNPDVLLLDEPTNHLDIKAIEWLENYLNHYSGTCLFISHDRAFIDHCAHEVGELENGRLTLYKGNYSAFVEQRRVVQEFASKEAERLKKEVEYEAAVAQTMLSHRKMSSFHAREKKVAKLSDALSDAKNKIRQARGSMHFKYIADAFTGDPNRVIVRAQELSKHFPDKALFDHVNFELRARDKMICVGPNGCGKSTLMKLLNGQEANFEGEVWLSPTVTAAHMDQYTSFENENVQIIDEVLASADLSEREARNLLASYGFRANDVYKSISVLSGGERSRLYLCCLLLEKPDLLFLDEPTNHLDIESKDILEKAMADFPGAIFGISHDRYFIERIADKVLGFANGTAESYFSYREYRQVVIRMDEAKKRAQEQQRSENDVGENRSLNKAQLRKEKAKLMQAMSELDKKIADLEVEKQLLEAKFSDPTEGGAAYKRYAAVLSEIETHSDRYLEIGIELEELSRLAT